MRRPLGRSVRRRSRGPPMRRGSHRGRRAPGAVPGPRSTPAVRLRTARTPLPRRSPVRSPYPCAPLFLPPGTPRTREVATPENPPREPEVNAGRTAATVPPSTRRTTSEHPCERAGRPRSVANPAHESHNRWPRPAPDRPLQLGVNMPPEPRHRRTRYGDTGTASGRPAPRATRTLPHASRAAPFPPSVVRRRGMRPAVPTSAATPPSTVVVTA